MNDILYPLAGGVVIGISTILMLFFLGRITGISGILSSTLKRPSVENAWRYFFILGLLVGGIFLKTIFPEIFNYNYELPVVPTLVAGVLVGYATMLGSGCTSGHGVCGISRFSARSIFATLLFISSGVVTVYLKGVL